MRRLVLDIETVPVSSDSLEPDDAKKASLDALTGRIICIGGMILDEFQVTRSLAMVSDQETKLLNWFWSLLKDEHVRSFVAHNGLSFDLPFIWKRSVILGIRPSIPFDLRRYRTEFVFDTMCVWANWEIKGNVSLNRLSQALNIGSKNGDGSQVLDLWQTGRFHDIAQYCLQDCWLTYACYCRMNFVVHGRHSIEDNLITVDISGERANAEP